MHMAVESIPYVRRVIRNTHTVRMQPAGFCTAFFNLSHTRHHFPLAIACAERLAVAMGDELSMRVNISSTMIIVYGVSSNICRILAVSYILHAPSRRIACHQSHSVCIVCWCVSFVLGVSARICCCLHPATRDLIVSTRR